DRGQVSRRLDFLKPQLAVAEHLIHHLLRHHAHRLDVGGGFALQFLDSRRPRRGRCGRLRWRSAPSALSAESAGHEHGQRDGKTQLRFDHVHQWSCPAAVDMPRTVGYLMPSCSRYVLYFVGSLFCSMSSESVLPIVRFLSILPVPPILPVLPYCGSVVRRLPPVDDALP